MDEDTVKTIDENPALHGAVLQAAACWVLAAARGCSRLASRDQVAGSTGRAILFTLS